MRIGKSELICSCNLEIMKSIPDKSFALLMTDIPYGINASKMAFLTEKNTTVKQKNGRRLNANKNKEYQLKDWDSETPPQKWFDEACRISKHQIFFGSEYVNYEGMGSGRIKWNKGVPENLSFKGYEEAYCSFIEYVEEVDYLWSGMNQGKSILEPMVMQGNKKLNEKREHPTHKPVNLWKKIIVDICIPLKIDISSVVDTNMGAGSLLVASMDFDQIEYCLGIDIEKDYWTTAVTRVKRKHEKIKNNPKLF